MSRNITDREVHCPKQGRWSKGQRAGRKKLGDMNMITALKESHKKVDTTREVSQQAAEAAHAADDAANQLQTLGDGMELLIQSLEEEVQGPLRGKAPEHGNNPNRDREVDHEAEKARRKRDRQRMPPPAGLSTRSGPQEPSATIEQDSVSTCWCTEEETDCELEARDRQNICEGICRSKRTYDEQEVLKAVTQQSLREMMKSDADSVSTTTSILIEHQAARWKDRALELRAQHADKLVKEAYTAGIKGEAFDKLIESARVARSVLSSSYRLRDAFLTADKHRPLYQTDKDIVDPPVDPPVQQDVNIHVPWPHRQIQAIPHAVSLAVKEDPGDGVAKMVRAALEKHKDSELNRSVLAKAGVRFPEFTKERIGFY
ncbi:hypothetical protein K439DRAFT_1613565 [Ramaria rubella]|nr:hypothetical protein K439DRAFT_1613565 [Ramaria rubella]